MPFTQQEVDNMERNIAHREAQLRALGGDATDDQPTATLWQKDETGAFRGEPIAGVTLCRYCKLPVGTGIGCTPCRVRSRPNPADANPKDIAGRAKPQMHLIPAAAKVEVAKVMGLGAVKYGPYNWRDIAVAYGPYLAAIDRHATAFIDGQANDPESGVSHLAHIAAGAMILLDAIITGNAIDDRPKPNPLLASPRLDP